MTRIPDANWAIALEVNKAVAARIIEVVSAERPDDLPEIAALLNEHPRAMALALLAAFAVGVEAGFDMDDVAMRDE